MRRPIPKYLTLCVIVSILCLEHAFGQCQFEVKYSVEKKSESAFSIYLQSETALASVKIQLYDLFQGKVLEEKEIYSLTTVAQEIFKNISPSKYAIIITMDNCDKPKTLGGIDGINIGIQD
jgi:hypothetical protein